MSRAAILPDTLDLSTIRAITVQRDGRWPPLDTLARDCVESVTDEMFFQGYDPVLIFLDWTFDPSTAMTEPLIPIRNAELRGELELPEAQEVFSYAELVSHRRLRELAESLAHVEGRKLNPLESKVSGIEKKLSTLDAVFRGSILRPIPDPKDPNGTWTALATAQMSNMPKYQSVNEAWSALRHAFHKDDAAAFAAASVQFRDALAALPAASRPDPKLTAVELRFNRIEPFRIAWQIMVAGAVLAAIALANTRSGSPSPSTSHQATSGLIPIAAADRSEEHTSELQSH